jgi:hypothetical protein
VEKGTNIDPINIMLALFKFVWLINKRQRYLETNFRLDSDPFNQRGLSRTCRDCKYSKRFGNGHTEVRFCNRIVFKGMVGQTREHGCWAMGSTLEIILRFTSYVFLREQRQNRHCVQPNKQYEMAVGKKGNTTMTRGI